MAIAAIQFLTSVVKSMHSQLFAQENTLQQICEKVVVPNLKLRDSDEELFELNPMDYIQRDTEGSDSGTRRRSAADFVKALTDAFPTEVTNLFTGMRQLKWQTKTLSDLDLHSNFKIIEPA